MPQNILNVPKGQSPDGSDKNVGNDKSSSNPLKVESTTHLSASPADNQSLITMLAFAQRTSDAQKGSSGLLKSFDLTNNNTDRQQRNSDFKIDNTSMTSVNADGTKCSYDMVRTADGSLQPRIIAAVGQDGSHRQYIYSDNTNQPSRMIDTTISPEGKTIQQIRERTANGTYQLTEYEGTGKQHYKTNTESEYNVQTHQDGRVTYNRQERINSPEEAIIKLRLAQAQLIAGDLPSAKERFLNTFASHGGNTKTADALINQMINRNHERKSAGLKYANDDQIASTLRSLNSIYETDSSERKGVASNFTDNQITSRVSSALKSLGNPEKYNNQGLIGTCTLNSALYIAENLHPDKVAKTFAQIMTKGEWRNHQYTLADLSARNGRDSFNNMMTNAMGSTFGANHIDRGFGGATHLQGNHAYKAMTGKNLHGLKVDGMGLQVTMGGRHMQVAEYKAVNGRKVVELENWHDFPA